MIIQRTAETVAATLSSTSLHSSTCDDINNCRTISTIVYNCLATIFLCTWVVLHPNVPKNPQRAWWKKLFRRARLTMLALLAPEIILSWAFSQWIDSCRDLKERHEKHPGCTWTETHAMLADMDGLVLMTSQNGREPVNSLTSLPPAVESLMPPEEQIEDRSKSDNIAKAIALTQALWFAVQAAHRASKGLDVTELELTTLGHVVLSVFVYWCWWNKPSNVEFPIVVDARNENGGNVASATNGETAPPAPQLSFRIKIGAYIQASIGEIQTRSWRTWVFFVCLTIIGGMFGAVHCLAWNSTFPTRVEQILWRVCAVIVTAAPGLTIIFFLPDMKGSGVDVSFTGIFLLVIAYTFSRIGLLVLALMALRDLPYSALETASWTLFIPHIG